MGLRKGTAVVLCQAVSGRTQRQPTHGILVCCGHKFLILMRKSHILLCEQCGSNCTDLCGKPIVSWIKDWNSRPRRNCSGFLLFRFLFQIGVVEEEAVIPLQNTRCRWGHAACSYLIVISSNKLESMTLEPLLHIHLQAGLSALKTPYPHIENCDTLEGCNQLLGCDWYKSGSKLHLFSLHVCCTFPLFCLDWQDSYNALMGTGL